MDNRILSFFAVLIVLSAAFAGAAALAASDPSDAADPTYGDIDATIQVAPGYKYSWAPSWPSDLHPTLTVEKLEKDTPCPCFEE